MRYNSFSVFIGLGMLIGTGYFILHPQEASRIAHFYPLKPLKVNELEAYRPKLDGATNFLVHRDIIKIPEGMTTQQFFK
ncbi:hypothetical protein TI03_00340 [Achromatium sp. WMS1]|nr:hypothetical protein TI03_00340 [Achromatium sp. WMS1]